MKRKNYFIHRKWIATLLLSMLFPFFCSAQIIISTSLTDYPAGTTLDGSTFVLSGVHLNEIKDYTLPVLVVLPYVITPSLEQGSCSEITNNNNVSVVDDVVSVEVIEKCNLNESSFLTFTLSASKSGFVPEQHNFRVPILRDSSKVVLTLDVSGSMGQTLDDGTTTRLDALKDAVNMLMPNLQDFQQEGDSLGITYFSTNVIQPDIANFPSNFIGITPSSEPMGSSSHMNVFTDLSPRTPMQMTAMGSGLLDAKAKLLFEKEKSPNTKRMAFLFTDGRQNQYPRVLDDGIELEDGSFLNDNQANPKDSIRYFVIATWDAGVIIETLVKIGEESGGATSYVNPDTSTDPDLYTWFIDQLTKMLTDGSPQLIINKKSKGIVDSLAYEFDLNENITRLAINLSFIKDDSLIIIVKNDDVDITHNATKLVGDNFQNLCFNFPVLENDITQSRGKWKLIVKGNTENSYHMAVIADDHYLKLNNKIDKKIYTVGDTMHISADLFYLGEALVSPNNSVQAIVLKPGDDLGNLLATYDTPEMDSLVDMNNDASAKFQELMENDSIFYNSILPTEQIVNLTNEGDGHFSGFFDKTELTGIYNVIFLIKGETDGSGSFERTDIISSVFKFGQIVVEIPEIVDSPPVIDTTIVTDTTAVVVDSIKGNQTSVNKTILRIRPYNKFGYYMGPGFKSKIKVKINKKPLRFVKAVKAQVSTHNEHSASVSDPYIEKIVDRLDGSYFIYLANVGYKDNPNINITVRGESLYDGNLRPIPVWFYILFIILVIVLSLVIKYNPELKTFKNLIWILILIWLVIYLLHRYGIYYLL